MRLQLRSLVAAVAMIFSIAAEQSAQAVDLLYVTLGNNTIVRYNTTGNNGTAIAATAAVFANTNLNNPSGLAIDAADNLYASNASGNTISKFNAAGAYLGNITSNLVSPRGLAVDASGKLYAANLGSSTISKFNSSGTYISNVATNLSFPLGLALDASGNLYASNAGDGTISKFNAAGTYLGNISLNLAGPVGLAFDTSGNLYAANDSNSTISKFDPSGTFLTSWSTGSGPRFLAFQPAIVPEPSTYALATIATGVMALIASRRKARRA